MYALGLERKHISLVRVGDIVVHQGRARTVSGTDLKRCDFMGTSIFGDSYHIGYRPVFTVRRKRNG